MFGNSGQSASAKNHSSIYQTIYQAPVHYTQNTASPWFRIDAEFVKDHNTADETTLRDYIEGMQCTWGLVFKDMLAVRPMLETLLESVRRHNIVALLGAGAEGKTTLLMQTAYRLYQENWSVWYASRGPLTPPPLKSKQTVFIIDNAPLCDDLHSFLRDAVSRGWRVLFAGRKNEWNRYARSHFLSERNLTLIETGGTERDAEIFAQYLGGKAFIETPAEVIREQFLYNSNGFLYAAMLEAVHGKSLEEIARDILYKIAPPDAEDKSRELIKLIAFVCLLESFRNKCPAEMYLELLKTYKLKKHETEKLLEKEIQRIGPYVETRHPHISGLFLRYIEEDYEGCKEDALQRYLTFYFSGAPMRFVAERTQIVWKLISAVCECEDEDLLLYITSLLTESNRPNLDFLKYILAHAPEYMLHDICVRFYERNCQNRKNFQYPDFFVKWADIEEREGNISDSVEEPEPYTARWIYRQGTESIPDNGNLWYSWGRMEEQQNNTGKSVKDPYTARWIYHQGVIKSPSDNHLWYAWGQMEEGENNLGDSVEDPYTVRWIYRQGTINTPNDPQAWLAWMELELSIPNRLRGFQEKYTAEWIAETGYRSCKLSPLLLNAVCIAIIDKEYEKARGLLLENMNDTLRRNPAHAWYGLYICCKLLGMEQEADAFYEALTVDIGEAKSHMLELGEQHKAYEPVVQWLKENA